jgi:hypothetical protein
MQVLTVVISHEGVRPEGTDKVISLGKVNILNYRLVESYNLIVRYMILDNTKFI